MTPEARREVLGLPAALLRRLPASSTLVCRCADVGGVDRDCWVTTSSKHAAAAAAAFFPAVDGHAWLALVLAAQAGRAALALSQWLSPDRYGVVPTWYARGSLYALTGNVHREQDSAAIWDDYPIRVTVGDVLAHFRAELVELDPPLTPPRPAGVL